MSFLRTLGAATAAVFALASQAAPARADIVVLRDGKVLPCGIYGRWES